MLQPTPPVAHSHDHRPRVHIPGHGWHIPVRDIDTLEGIAWGTGLPPVRPEGGIGWARTHVGNVNFCAWQEAIR